ncbi:MAG: DUF4335 domain-containing protein [Nostocales cyanobacterium]|nr:MAG: DUF4335 domain-containing protein [Nostocales cyanobacterium]
MPRSNSVMRRYTPPTCTLEILAESSPLSRWMGQTVVDQLRFKLHFDDPSLPEEGKVPIQGDREQLETLCNAVTNYVLQLLQKSADSFYLTSLESSQLNTKSEQPELKDVAPTPLSSKTINPSSMGILEATIYLESNDHLTHKLYLGSLANQTSGPIIQLTLLQLFDLATALEEYSTDVITLPNLKGESSVPSLSSLPVWTPVAAMLALAVGLTPLTWQYASKFQQSQQQTAKNSTSASEKVALESSPSLDSTTPQPGLTPFANLPSPPAGSNTMPLPNLDTPIPPADTTLDPSPLAFPNSTVPSTAKTLPKNRLAFPPQIKSISPTTLQLPSTKTSSQRNSTGVVNQNDILLTTGQNSSSIPNVANLPNDIQSQIPQQISSQPEPQSLNQSPNSVNQTSTPASDHDLMAKLRAARTTPLPTDAAAEENKLFDIPQMAEASEYLQKNWRPPAGFSQTLEYSLILNIDGSIERIFPLNQAAREYVDNTGIPQIGKPFVSTNKAGQNLKLRVVFSPDGKVQAFPENP